MENNEIQRLGNRLARSHGHGRADRIVFGADDRIIRHIKFGHRKYTTGEYVSNAYRANFGWKNTYYCHAHTTVMLRIF